MPNFYFDTEFIEGTQTKRNFLGFQTNKQTIPTIDLISIGIVADDGREYYAVSSDFNLDEAWNRWQPRQGEGDRNNIEPKHYWIRENVLKPIFEEFYPANHANLHLYPPFNFDTMQDVILTIGKTRRVIANEVVEFVFGNDITDGLSCESFITAAQKYNFTHLKSPINFYAYYADYDWVVFCWLFGKMNDMPKDFPKYCRDLNQSLDDKWDVIQTHRTKRLAFESKGIPNLKAHPKYPKHTDEHHALVDARWNKKLHEFLKTL